MDKATEFKFSVRIDFQACKPKNTKSGQVHISGMGKVQDFKFGVRIDRQVYKPKHAKVGQKGSGLRHVTYFYNFCNPATFFSDFGTPCVSMEVVK